MVLILESFVWILDNLVLIFLSFLLVLGFWEDGMDDGLRCRGMDFLILGIVFFFINVVMWLIRVGFVNDKVLVGILGGVFKNVVVVLFLDLVLDNVIFSFLVLICSFRFFFFNCISLFLIDIRLFFSLIFFCVIVFSFFCSFVIFKFLFLRFLIVLLSCWILLRRSCFFCCVFVFFLFIIVILLFWVLIFCFNCLISLLVFFFWEFNVFILDVKLVFERKKKIG